MSSDTLTLQHSFHGRWNMNMRVNFGPWVISCCLCKQCVFRVSASIKWIFAGTEAEIRISTTSIVITDLPSPPRTSLTFRFDLKVRDIAKERSRENN